MTLSKQKEELRSLAAMIMQKREAGVQEHLENLPFRKKDLKKGIVFNEDAFEKMVKDDKQLGFKEAKTQSGSSILEILGKESTPEIKAARQTVRSALTAVLNTNANAFNAAKKEYKQSRIELQEHLQKAPDEQRVDRIWSVMKHDGDDAIKALKEHQKQGKEALQQKLDDSSFRTDLKKALEALSDSEVDTAIQNLKDELEASYKTQLDNFSKATEASCKSVLSSDAKAKADFLFIADLHRNDAAMRRVIEEQARINAESKGGGTTTATWSKNGLDISSVSLDQLKYIKAQALGKGGEIKHDNGVFTLNMNSRWYSPLYYGSKQDERDLLTMAQAVRASGSSTIKFKLNFDDPKIAQKRGREAYEACIKAGFPPEKIKIVINGTLLTHTAQEKNDKNPEKSESIREVLFAKRPGDFDKLQVLAQKYKKQLAELTEDLDTDPSRSQSKAKKYKEEIRSAKAKAAPSEKIRVEIAEEPSAATQKVEVALPAATLTSPQSQPEETLIETPKA